VDHRLEVFIWIRIDNVLGYSGGIYSGLDTLPG